MRTSVPGQVRTAGVEYGALGNIRDVNLGEIKRDSLSIAFSNLPPWTGSDI